MVLSLAILLPLLSATAYAANDWSKPCFQGECSYDLPEAKDPTQSATGTIRIWGSENAIADVTDAGGWEIIGCSADATSQSIRLVCKSDDAESACNHLYKNGGAVDKIVRLPENCGANAFARVSRAWIPGDQTLPDAIATKIVRRDSAPPQVKALALDTNFSSVDPTKNGPVSIAIQGMNAPGYENKLATVPLARRNRRRYSARPSKRGFFDDVLGFLGDALDSFTQFDIEKSTQLPPIDVDEPFNLVDQSIDCGAAKASVKVDVDAKAHAVVDIGIVATGTIIPPKLDNFNVFTGLTANLTGSMSLVADAVGEISTGEITIFEVGIPGLDFPGILQVGPSFKVNALAKAALDVKLDMEVGLNYQVKNARLVFPPDNKQNASDAFNLGDTPLKLSISPSVEATGSVEAHLIPQLDIGLQAFSLVDATVFINLDAAAILDLTLKAGANIGIGVGGSSSSVAMPHATQMKDLPASSTMAGHSMTTPPSMMHETAPPKEEDKPATASMKETPSMKEEAMSMKEECQSMKDTPAPMPTMEPHASMPVKADPEPTPMHEAPAPMQHEAGPMMRRRKFPRRHLAVLDVRSPTRNAPTARELAISTDLDTFFSGCVGLKASLTVNAGANADFLGLFNEGTTAELFKREFQLFQKCFGDKAGMPKRGLPASSLPAIKTRQLAGLICAAPEIANAIKIADGNVKAADAKTI